jgi:UDP-N-acetylmuramoylalanine--D-glutamate ligase
MTGTFAGERAVVVGAGVAGAACAVALATEGAEVRVLEERDRGALASAAMLERAGVELRTGPHARGDLDGATVVVPSPGIAPNAPVLSWASERGIRVWGELEVGARLAGVPYVAVTGTNGKTTTTGMVAACLRASGLDAVACGNIGYPFVTAAREEHDVLVVEVSSFQLVTQTSFHPRVSALLNVAPDHLDWHGTFDAYADAKARVYANQGAGDIHVGNRDDELAATISASAPCPSVWFRAGPPREDEVGYEDDELIARLGPTLRLGVVDGARAGYRADAAAAAAIALRSGASGDAVASGLVGFEPARHRGETVAEVAGVRFVDNSKATNVHAALAAIDGVDGAVLIAGGRAKGQDLAPLASRAERLRAVVAIGESAGEVVAAFAGAGLPAERAGSIEEAVGRSFALAGRPGIVLLAPACASWDQFTDYVERGERFAAAARALREGARSA